MLVRDCLNVDYDRVRKDQRRTCDTSALTTQFVRVLSETVIGYQDL